MNDNMIGCTCMEPGCLACKLTLARATIADLRGKAEGLEAIVSRLPKTADGARVVPLDSAWAIVDFYGRPCDPVEGTVCLDEDWKGFAVQLLLPGNNPAMRTMKYLPVGDCYSTREAAEAAEEQP